MKKLILDLTFVTALIGLVALAGVGCEVEEPKVEKQPSYYVKVIHHGSQVDYFNSAKTNPEQTSENVWEFEDYSGTHIKIVNPDCLIVYTYK